MREPPPPQLVALVERLGLASAGQVARMAARVHRLARDLPRFESVWVDALAQARILTPFQAAEINAGRGELLRIGPYLLCDRLAWPDHVHCYLARRSDSPTTVRLAVVTNAGRRAGDLLRRLEALAAVADKCQREQVAAVIDAGSDGDRLWAASPWTEGLSAAEWMAHNGRFPPEAALEIARAMLASLVVLEQAGVCHGDISTAGLALTADGGVVLPLPGVRAIVRPEEGYAHADLLPQAYDYLAPERVADGTPPNTASDIYACGCVWWHLLCGRPPLSGGDSLAKLRAAQAAAVVDVRRFAPEVPGPLAAALAACVQRDPKRRPESMARLAATLGPPTRNGRLGLARCLVRPRAAAAHWPGASAAARRHSPVRLWLTGAAVCLVAAVAAVWPTWGGRTREKGTVSISLPRQEQCGQKAPLASRRAAAPGEVQDLVLSSGGPIDGGSLRLSAGQRVCGPKGKRPLVKVPRGGLVVDFDGLCFDGIDFVWSDAAAGDAARQESAVIWLRAARAEFRGCRFQSTGAVSTMPAAVSWSHPAGGGDASALLPSGRLKMSDCVLRGVEAGVDCHSVGAMAVELVNTLHLGAGPLVRLDHWPKPDEPTLITASQVTVRGGGPLLECRYQQVGSQPGEISIRAAGCAFVPRPGTPLLLLCGPGAPEQLLTNILWTGQGSLVSPHAVVAAWQRPDGGRQVMDDSAASIAGLVRSEVDFAGNVEADPGASRVVRWQAPLQSTDAPGIDAEALP